VMLVGRLFHARATVTRNDRFNPRFSALWLQLVCVWTQLGQNTNTCYAAL